MPAGGDKQGVLAKYTVNDVAPTVTSVTLDDGTPIALNLKGSTTNVAAVSTDVTDNNGYLDITGATAVIYRTTKTADCSADDNNCYQVATGDCVQSAGDGATCTYTCTAAFKYYADPTDVSSGYAADTWSAIITASDESGSGFKVGDTPVELGTNTALSVTEASIAYSTVVAGADTGITNETTTVVNEGNSPIDTNLYGIDMVKDPENGTIPVEQQHYKLLAFTYGTPPVGGTALLVSTGVDVDTETTKPTSTDISDEIFWGIGILEGTATGDYAGTNTFTAVLSSDWPS